MKIRRDRLLLHSLIFLSLIGLSILSMELLTRLYQPPRTEPRLVLDGTYILTSPLLGVSTNSVPFNMLFSSRKESQIQAVDLSVDFMLVPETFTRPVLVIPVMDGNAYQVSLNGTVIHQAGDMRRGQSTRWNHSEYIVLDRSLFKRGANRLTLSIRSLSSLGFTVPMYIAEDTAAGRHVFLLNLINNSLIMASIGFLLLLGIIFLSIGFYINRNWGRVFMGIALVLLSVYFLDFYFIEILPFPYAVFKKVVMAAFYTSLGFLSLAYCREYRMKSTLVSDILAVLFFLSGLTMLLLPADTILIKNVYYRLNLLALLFLINTLYIILRTFLQRRDVFSALQLHAMGFILPFFIHDLVGLFLSTNILLFTTQAIVIFYLITAGVIIGAFVDVHFQMISLRRKSELEKDPRFTDELTAAFSPAIIRQIRDLIPEHFTLALLDLDDLDQFNKRYGYYTGDYILSTLAYLLRNSTRGIDYIIRLQEDSFLLLLAECSLSTGLQIVQDFQKTVKNHLFILEGFQIKDTITFCAAILPKGVEEAYPEMELKLWELMREAKTAGPSTIRY